LRAQLCVRIDPIGRDVFQMWAVQDWGSTDMATEQKCDMSRVGSFESLLPFFLFLSIFDTFLFSLSLDAGTGADSSFPRRGIRCRRCRAIAMGVSFVLVGALQMLRRPSLSSWGVLFCPVRWCRDPSAQIGKCIVTIFIFM